MHLYSKIVDLRKIQLIFLAATDIENCFSRSSSWLFSKAIKIRYFYKWIFFKKCKLASYSDVCKMRTSDKNIQNILEWEFCWFTELLRKFYGTFTELLRKFYGTFSFAESLWFLIKTPLYRRREKTFWDLLRHHKEVWKYKFNLIFISVQLSEMHGMLRLNSVF